MGYVQYYNMITLQEIQLKYMICNNNTGNKQSVRSVMIKTNKRPMGLDAQLNGWTLLIVVLYLDLRVKSDTILIVGFFVMGFL